jgi:hypothetical protein
MQLLKWGRLSPSCNGDTERMIGRLVLIDPGSVAELGGETKGVQRPLVHNVGGLREASENSWSTSWSQGTSLWWKCAPRLRWWWLHMGVSA